MKKEYIIAIGVIIILIFVFFLIRGDEDSWIKNEKGEYIKHGVPSETPDYVLEQQQAVTQAFELYNKKQKEGMVFSSQCLGVVGEEVKYAVDIVNVPRNDEDDKPENQCSEFREGIVEQFIELDQEGKIVRIV